MRIETNKQYELAALIVCMCMAALAMLYLILTVNWVGALFLLIPMALAGLGIKRLYKKKGSYEEKE